MIIWGDPETSLQNLLFFDHNTLYVIVASSSSFGAGRHLCQENESPQLDGWVVVGEMRSRYWNSCSPQDVRTASMLFPREIWGGAWRRIIVCRSDFGHSCENHKMEQASKGLKKHMKKYHSGEQDHCLGHSCWNYSKGNLGQFFQPESTILWGKDTDITSHKHKTEYSQGIPSVNEQQLM